MGAKRRTTRFGGVRAVRIARASAKPPVTAEFALWRGRSRLRGRPSSASITSSQPIPFLIIRPSPVCHALADGWSTGRDRCARLPTANAVARLKLAASCWSACSGC